MRSHPANLVWERIAFPLDRELPSLLYAKKYLSILKSKDIVRFLCYGESGQAIVQIEVSEI
jgi:hypothetical protein